MARRNETALGRVQRVLSHISPFDYRNTHDYQDYDDLDPEYITHKVFFPDLHDFRNDLRKHFKDNKDFYKPPELNDDELKEWAYQRMVAIIAAKKVSVMYLEHNPSQYCAFFENCYAADANFPMKISVQFNLFATCIVNLGNQTQKDALYPDIDNGNIIGCFAMTELGHGSNVRQLETTAIYDKATGEFVINSPTISSHKFWIGNASKYGNLAVVFANLIVEGDSKGIHPFLVPLRERKPRVPKTGVLDSDISHLHNCALLPGVQIWDCGRKLGLNGVDNGRIAFTNVRIPRTNLLDRYASVDTHGVYSSVIEKEGLRFAAHIGGLIIARIILAIGATVTARTGVAIAIMYGLQRKQFGPAGNEQPIASYLSWQRRLFPVLAQTYAVQLYGNYCKERYRNRSEADIKDVHTLVAGLKASASWHAANALQHARECCGGQGVLRSNVIGYFRVDCDAFVTVDGDNVVLMQQVAGGLLGEFRKKYGSRGVLGIVEYLKDNFEERVRMRLLDKHMTASEHLRDSTFQLAAFQWREKSQTFTLAMSLQQRIKELKKHYRKTATFDPAFQAWNDCLDQVTKLGQSFIDRVLLERFIFAIDQETAKTSSSNSNQAVVRDLTLLKDLFALSRLEAEASWFLANKVFTGRKSNAITREINYICREMYGKTGVRVLKMAEGMELPDYVKEDTIAVGIEKKFSRNL